MMASSNPTPWDARRPSLGPSGQTLPSIGNLAGINGTAPTSDARDSGNWSLTSSQRTSNSKPTLISFSPCFFSSFAKERRVVVACAGRIGSLSLKQSLKSHYHRSMPMREAVPGNSTTETLCIRRRRQFPLALERPRQASIAHTPLPPGATTMLRTMAIFRHHRRRHHDEAASTAD
jgi:hypothetical protein